MLRRLTRHPITQAALAGAIGLYLAGVYRTTRWTLVGEAHLHAAFARPGGGTRPVLCAFWHERLPLMSKLWLEALERVPATRGMRAHVLVSRHRDGRFIGDVIARFKLDTVYASTSRGGSTGLRMLLRLLAAGDTVAITPDGPRGPRRVAAPGVAQLAAMSGLPVLPCAARTTRARLLPSWDRMVFPLPFARGVLAVGAAIPVDRAAPEAALPAIEAALSAACDTADAWAGAAAGVAGNPSRA
jgi:lysophospholipid acyltransferase (LPLAT)-like uncharacterized protein